MNTVNKIHSEIKEKTDQILSSIDWNSKGLKPSEYIQLIEIKAKFTWISEKINKLAKG